VKLVFLQQGINNLLLKLGAQCLLDLALHVASHFGTESLFATFRNTEGCKKIVVHFRQNRLFNLDDLHLELSRFAFQVLGVIVLWESQIQSPLLSCRSTYQTLFKAWNHP